MCVLQKSFVVDSEHVLYSLTDTSNSVNTLTLILPWYLICDLLFVRLRAAKCLEILLIKSVLQVLGRFSCCFISVGYCSVYSDSDICTCGSCFVDDKRFGVLCCS